MEPRAWPELLEVPLQAIADSCLMTASTVSRSCSPPKKYRSQQLTAYGFRRTGVSNRSELGVSELSSVFRVPNAELQTQEVLSTGLCLSSKTRVSKQTTMHTTNPLVFIGRPKAANEQCWD